MKTDCSSSPSDIMPFRPLMSEIFPTNALDSMSRKLANENISPIWVAENCMSSRKFGNSTKRILSDITVSSITALHTQNMLLIMIIASDKEKRRGQEARLLRPRPSKGHDSGEA